uniref:Uncharacterized protein n=1 Tax=Branchiostoma floridae TaxID=7739 RepID=C3ZI32_BRAFL|eukprot:XP_002591763.1 hypothetical protein BRAFLDRAFT_83537 [Branchiostoma floridae]
MTLPPELLKEIRVSIADSQITVTNVIQGLVAVAVYLVIVGLLLGLNHFRWESPFKHWERDSELEDYLAHFMSPPRTMDSPILSRSYIMEFSQKFDPDPRSRSGVDNPGFVERPDVRTARPALETEV